MMTVNAPAKINLYLDVMDRRSDGYHNIKSVMQTVSLSDRVTVKKSDKITLRCSDPSLPCDEKNLAYKAALLFFEETGIDGGCEITVEKNIPVAGGLAGGSTDAAAVLKALNSIYSDPITEDTLIALSAKIGADVPFCLMGGCALCTGIGEELIKLDTKFSMPLVIARDGEGVSTPKGYAMLDEKYKETLSEDFGSLDSVISALSANDRETLFSSAYNIFEEVILPTHSKAKYLKNSLISLGAAFTMMSGSGPSVFAFFESDEKAEAAASALRETGCTAVACHTMP